MGKSEALSGPVEGISVTEEGGDTEEIYLCGWRSWAGEYSQGLKPAEMHGPWKERWEVELASRSCIGVADNTSYCSLCYEKI